MDGSPGHGSKSRSSHGLNVGGVSLGFGGHVQCELRSDLPADGKQVDPRDVQPVMLVLVRPGTTGVTPAQEDVAVDGFIDDRVVDLETEFCRQVQETLGSHICSLVEALISSSQTSRVAVSF